MKECLFILPYFGRLNDYFQLFLKSCEYNTKFNWLILTDDTTEFHYPANVLVKYMIFSELVELVQSKFDFPICLSKPYKLCDFKPAYGYVFNDYINEYRYWGYCDCDVIFGNLDRLLLPILEQGYDKLFAAGHMTLFKNDEVNNTLFMSRYQNRLLYRLYFSEANICWFDEDWKDENIHSLFISSGRRVYGEDLSLNPSGKYARFRMRRYDGSRREFVTLPYTPAVYVWQEGNLMKLNYDTDSGQIYQQEYLYIHFQHRNMSMNNGSLVSKMIRIVPNRFTEIKALPGSYREWKKLSGEPATAYLYTIRRLKKKVVNKIKKIIHKTQAVKI